MNVGWRYFQCKSRYMRLDDSTETNKIVYLTPLSVALEWSAFCLRSVVIMSIDNFFKHLIIKNISWWLGFEFLLVFKNRARLLAGAHLLMTINMALFLSYGIIISSGFSIRAKKSWGISQWSNYIFIHLVLPGKTCTNKTMKSGSSQARV